MRLDPNSEEAQTRMLALTQEMEGQTDRGVAIVGAAWVEEAMSAALESFLHTDPKAWQRLFKGNSPLGTFSAKIDLVRLLGLVTEVVYSDLHRIREIRNEFAHQIAHRTEHTSLNFDSSHIRDRCMALKCVAHETHSTPRAAFIRACATLNSDFQMLEMFREKVNSDGPEIFARIEHGGV
jgi:DNA-binding MltR family transcriptional regulator